MSDFGFPKRSTVKRLLFNPVSKAVAVSVRPRGETSPVTRLYWRRNNEGIYHQLGRPQANISFDSPVVATSAPFLFFNVIRYRKLNAGMVKKKGRPSLGGLWGGDWVGVYRADLRDGKVQGVLNGTQLAAIVGIGQVWVSSLVLALEDGRGVYAVIGFPKAADMSTDLPGVGTVKLTKHVAYHLCKLDLKAKQLEKLTQLQGTFY